MGSVLPVDEIFSVCPDCGAPVAGREACQALWDEISLRAYTNLAYARVRDLGFDAYCMQHPRYTLSAKSYAAHLTRLCCGLEFNADPAVYAAIRRWLDGRLNLTKPAPPDSVGNVTVADLHPMRDGEEHIRLVYAWANNVWAAYASQHALAREWIRLAQVGKGIR